MVLEKNDQQQRQTGGEGVAVQQQSCLMIVPPKAEHAENGVGPHSTCSSSSGDQQHGYANGHAVPLARSASAGAPMTKDLDYLAQLLKDKKQLSAFPNVFGHVERLVDEEINRVRVAIFQCEFTGEPLQLPEPMGEVTVHQKKVFVPVKQYPEYNFVGRILGPRGMTAKQLETETGCKIMVRGKGSMRDKKKEEANRGKPNWEHLAEELHVIIQCEDTQNRAELKIARAVEEVNKLMVPAPEGEDELKKKQLMELAILNGTFRNSATASVASSATPSIVHTPNGIGIMVGKADVGGTPLLQLDHQHLLGYSAAAPMTNSSGLAGSPLIMPSAGAVKANPIAQSLVNNPLAAAQALALQQLAAPNTASTVAQLFGVSAAVPYGLATSSAVDYQQQLLALGQLQQQQQQHSQFDSAQLSLLLQQQQLAFAALQQQQQFGVDASATGSGCTPADSQSTGGGGHMLTGQRRFVGHMRDSAHPYSGGK